MVESLREHLDGNIGGVQPGANEEAGPSLKPLSDKGLPPVVPAAHTAETTRAWLSLVTSQLLAACSIPITLTSSSVLLF